MQTHEYFEELCALLPIGQLSADEYQELAEHLRGCSGCREATDDFSVILDKLPVGEAEVDEKTLIALQGDSYRTRFLERAAAEGIHFSDAVMRPQLPVKKWSWPYIRLVPSLATLSATAILLLVVLVTKLSQNRPMNEQPTVPSVHTTAQSVKVQKQEVSKLETKVATVVAEANEQQAVIASLRAKLNNSRAESQFAKRELSNTSEELERLQTQAGNLQRELDSAKADLIQARSQKDSVDAALVDQQFKINQLAAEVKEKDAAVERERELTLVSKDVRELMGARNLHILDVSDVDGNGRSRKSFGRVFLVEDQLLIFYAFDLGDHENPAKVSFQAWGQLEGHETVAKNLGVFYVDDHAQKRWVLKVNDPKKLSAINSVFVTVEPLGGAPRPTGKKLLYAYLGTQANHP